MSYPNTYRMGCSTSGGICGSEVFDDSLVVTAVHFEYSTIESVQVQIDEHPSSYEAGEYVSKSLPKDGLQHVLCLLMGLVFLGVT